MLYLILLHLFIQNYMATYICVVAPCLSLNTHTDKSLSTQIGVYYILAMPF